MTIKKYLHSCICLEANGKRLLIDPGVFSFVEAKLQPEDIGAVDVVLFTHAHADHYDPIALKRIVTQSVIPSLAEGSRREPPTILTPAGMGATLQRDGFASEAIAAGETKTIAGFAIQALGAVHGPIPAEPPDSLAYLVNGIFLHPGDSFSISGIEHADVLALPLMAPFARVVDALAFARALTPRHVIPIHDAYVKDFMCERLTGMCKANLEPIGAAFHPLALGEALDV